MIKSISINVATTCIWNHSKYDKIPCTRYSAKCSSSAEKLNLTQLASDLHNILKQRTLRTKSTIKHTVSPEFRRGRPRASKARWNSSRDQWTTSRRLCSPLDTTETAADLHVHYTHNYAVTWSCIWGNFSQIKISQLNYSICVAFLVDT